MGLPGLQNSIERFQLYEKIDLFKANLKSNNGRSEVIVNFNAFQVEFIAFFRDKMIDLYQNTYQVLSLNEIEMYKAAVIDFHKLFERNNIDLIYIIDGNKEPDLQLSEVKEAVWREYFDKQSKKVKSILNSCENFSIPSDIDKIALFQRHNISLSALKEAGATVIRLFKGECEEVAMHLFYERKAYAILTNDTDFLMYSGCNVIFFQFFTTFYHKNSLNLPFINQDNSTEAIIAHTNTFEVPVVHQRKILDFLKLSEPSQMILVRILRGNRQHDEFKDFQTKFIGPKYFNIQIIANVIRSKRLTLANFENNSDIRSFMNKNETFRTFVEYCKDTFTMKQFNENKDKSEIMFISDDPNQCPLKRFLKRQIYETEISKSIYAIYFGFFTCNLIIEDDQNYSNKNLFQFVQPILRRFYGYVVNPTLTTMYEQASKLMTKIPVVQKDIKLHEIKAFPHDDHEHLSDQCRLSFMCNVSIFHEVVGANHMNLFATAANLKSGFIRYLMHKFHEMVPELGLSDEIFDRMYCAIMYKYDITNNPDSELNTILDYRLLRRISICPSPTTIIALNWFTELYFYLFFLIGSALQFEKQFPKAEELICSSIFYSFVEIVPGLDSQRYSVDEEISMKIEEVKTQIMDLYKSEHELIISDE